MNVASKEPQWTVFANLIRKDTRWVGESWEFFEDEPAAQARYDELHAQGHCPTKRRFHRANDYRHMNVVDQMWVDESRTVAANISDGDGS